MRCRDRRGVSESTQLAVLLPLLLLVSLGILQAGLWLHTRNVVHRAATAAVDVARGSHGDVEDARELAMELARSGGLTDVSVEVRRSATEATAVVRAQPVTILDVGLGRVTETAAAPVERATVP